MEKKKVKKLEMWKLWLNKKSIKFFSNNILLSINNKYIKFLLLFNLIIYFLE